MASTPKRERVDDRVARLARADRIRGMPQDPRAAGIGPFCLAARKYVFDDTGVPIGRDPEEDVGTGFWFHPLDEVDDPDGMVNVDGWIDVLADAWYSITGWANCDFSGFTAPLDEFDVGIAVETAPTHDVYCLPRAALQVPFGRVALAGVVPLTTGDRIFLVGQDTLTAFTVPPAGDPGLLVIGAAAISVVQLS